MAKDKTTLRFWLRTDRVNKDGTSPIHLIYQIKGDRKYYSVPGVKLFPINWDVQIQKAIFIEKKAAKKKDPSIDINLLLTSEDVAEINSKLSKLGKNIADIEKRFELDGAAFDCSMVLQKLKELENPRLKKEEPSVNIVDFINRFVNDSKGTHKAGTLKVYTGLANHLSDFERSKRLKVTFSNTDILMLRQFQSFMSQSRHRITKDAKQQDIKPMNNISIAKQISTLKTILNYARTIYKVQVNQDYRDFKVSRRDSDFEVITLTNEEFETLFNMDLSQNKKLDRVRDIFCFSCATGLRFSDLVDLKHEHIRNNSIKKMAVKTGQRLDIPLNPFSAAILAKHKNRIPPLNPLPMISNQKLNDYIRELGEVAKIDMPIEIVREYGKQKKSITYKKHELLSIHVGRKTFITLSLVRGMAPQNVMALSGHSQWKSFKRYVDVSDQIKKSEMGKAWGAMPDLNKLKAV
jgi:integrase